MIMTRKNNLVIHSFATTEAENEVIQKKMKLFGIKNKSTFFRVMILNGYMLKLDLPEIRETIRLLKNLTNNVNQIAKTLHEHGSMYETEIDDIKQRVDEIWTVFRKILARLDHAVCHRLLAKRNRFHGACTAGQSDRTSGDCELPAEQNGSHSRIL